MSVLGIRLVRSRESAGHSTVLSCVPRRGARIFEVTSAIATLMVPEIWERRPTLPKSGRSGRLWFEQHEPDAGLAPPQQPRRLVALQPRSGSSLGS